MQCRIANGAIAAQYDLTLRPERGVQGAMLYVKLMEDGVLLAAYIGTELIAEQELSADEWFEWVVRKSKMRGVA